MMNLKTTAAALILSAALPVLAQPATPATPAVPAVPGAPGGGATPAIRAVPATPATPAIDAREANQQRRIEKGARSGALTGKEAAKLEKGQAKVQRKEHTAKADGKVTAKERKRIAHAQNVQSKRIYHEKHDMQHDFNHNGRVDRPHMGRK